MNEKEIEELKDKLAIAHDTIRLQDGVIQSMKAQIKMLKDEIRSLRVSREGSRELK